MNITIQMPLPHSTDRIAAVMTAIESHTNRAIQAHFVCREWDPDRIEVSGTVKGVGEKTWGKWTVAARVALKRLGSKA